MRLLIVAIPVLLMVATTRPPSPPPAAAPCRPRPGGVREQVASGAYLLN